MYIVKFTLHCDSNTDIKLTDLVIYIVKNKQITEYTIYNGTNSQVCAQCTQYRLTTKILFIDQENNELVQFLTRMTLLQGRLLVLEDDQTAQIRPIFTFTSLDHHFVEAFNKVLDTNIKILEGDNSN